MIVLSNTTVQTLSPGQSITFDRTVLHSGCSECHRNGSAAVRLRNKGIYELHFSGSVAVPSGTPGEVILAIQAGGETLNETSMVSTPTALNAYNNVSTATLIKNCCGDYGRITVTNTGSIAVNIASNSSLFIKRLA